MFLENVKLALTALKANKLRTFLTMLGIIIGIAAVIAIMTIGESTVQQTKQEYAEMGTNLVNVSIYQSDSVDAEMAAAYPDEYRPLFTEDQVKSLVNQFQDSIGQLVMEVWCGDGKIYSDRGSLDDNYSSVDMTAVNRGFLEMPDKNFTFLAGKPFDRTNSSSDSNAIIISDQSAKLVFGSVEDAIGQKMHLHFSTWNGFDEVVFDQEVVVTGVYQYKQRGGTRDYAGTKANDIRYPAYFPYLSVKKLTDGLIEAQTSYFGVNLKPGTDVLAITDQMKAYLESLMPSDGRFEIECSANANYIKQAEDAVRQRNLVTTLTGAIALLVGGIGVMNIMTVSIIERTREIGTRKALGALNGDIRLQFITEAMVICLIGGVIGIIVGIVIGIGACKVQGIPVALSYQSIVVSFGVSLLIGLFFGYYPANKAAKMDPIEALRYE